jgi:hypothetical protein
MLCEHHLCSKRRYILTLDVQHGRAVASQSAFVWLVEFFILV